MTALTIRPYEATDHAAVRGLFIRINRELAPEALRERFEDYITSSLIGEIDRIPEYYDALRGCGFWVALREGVLVGNFGLEPAENDTAFELRRMYVDPQARRLGIARIMLDRAEAICRERGRLRMGAQHVGAAVGGGGALSRRRLSPRPPGNRRLRLEQDDRRRHRRFHLEKWL